MKFLFTVLITIFLCPYVVGQCPTNENTTINIIEQGIFNEVTVKFEIDYDSIKELKILKFGEGILEKVEIVRKSKKEFIIKDLKPGEYMIQIIGTECTSYVGTDKNFKGFFIK